MSTKQDVAELFLKCFENNSSSLITRERVRECYPNAEKWTFFMLEEEDSLLKSTLKELVTLVPEFNDTAIRINKNKPIDIALEKNNTYLLSIEVENKASEIKKEIEDLYKTSKNGHLKLMVLITYDSNETIRKTNRVGQWRYNFLNELSHYFQLNGGINCPFLLILGNLPIDMDTLNDNNREFHYVNWWCFLKRPDVEKWEEKHFISPKH